jgi:succinate dehydrogenase / fumarate reductase iron-sulfur subunit
MTNRIWVFMTYGSIVGIPAMASLFVLAHYLFPGIAYVFEALLALALITNFITGMREIYIVSKPIPDKLVVEPVSHVPAEATQRGKGKAVNIVISRFNPDRGIIEKKEYSVAADKYTSVLSALIKVKNYQDNTLSIRYSCGMGICGSCGMNVNGRPSLACETNLLKSAENGKVEVSPMLAHPVMKDLVTNFDDFFEKHKAVSPHIYKEDEGEKYGHGGISRQSREDLVKFLPFSYCIMCGLCLDACPVENTNPNFAGPQALSQVYRYAEDSRDGKGEKRIEMVNSKDGIWGCEFAGACSEVCPKGVDPASAIQLLKAKKIGQMLDPNYCQGEKSGADGI